MNSADQRFALVVPTINEVANIKVLLDRAVTALSRLPIPWEIIVVDDESSFNAQQALVCYRRRLAAT